MIFGVIRPKDRNEIATMALAQSALTDLLDALRAGGDLHLMRDAMQLVLQALIDLEATHHIGAAPCERSEARTTHPNGSRSGCCRPRPATWSWPSPSCARAASRPPCWSLAGASTGRRLVDAAVGLGLVRDGSDGSDDQLTDGFIGLVVEAVRPHPLDGHGRRGERCRRTTTRSRPGSRTTSPG